MATGLNTIGPLAVAMLAVWAIAVDSAHHAAPAPAVDCNSVILNLAGCLTFVTNGSTEAKPQGSCCSGLKMVLKTNAECLCEGFKNSAQLGVVLNVTKALALPSACHVSAPSVSNCALNTGSISSPAPSPLAQPPSSIAVAPIGSNQVAPGPAQGVPPSSAMAAAGSIAATVTAAAAAALLVVF
ncbi:PREDICTED: non-specific lipid-transfer protein-like protein At5g64080 [Ipomoea nil]|uniref:non-specific lipid-transfer protein-like protein At5g64080 n=1 Tax=Ipomoea nil TaxID=35883 RepID=UPI000900E685|nr:PREDICTED: non-specific lipid-transfer protein-like protein At5g64080 [Ipomoea nil]